MNSKMSESFNWQRFFSLFGWARNRKNLWFRIAFLIFFFIQLGYGRSKSTLDSVEAMNIYIITTLIVLVFIRFYAIGKIGVAQFLLLPATAIEKFLYAVISVFGAAFVFSFLLFGLGELSARVLFSVSHDWFAFNLDFTICAVFVTSMLFYMQFVKLKRWGSWGYLFIRFSMIVVCASIFLDHYLVEHYSAFSLVRLPLYMVLSVGFVVASYFQFLKSEATFQSKSRNLI